MDDEEIIVNPSAGAEPKRRGSFVPRDSSSARRLSHSDVASQFGGKKRASFVVRSDEEAPAVSKAGSKRMSHADIAAMYGSNDYAGMRKPRAKPIILVFGCSGHQGYAVCEAIRRDGTFKARGVTRYMDAPRAQALVQAGVEVVSSSDGAAVSEAFHDAYGAYITTPFDLDPAVSIALGRNVGDVAAQVGLHHVVWSCGENAKEVAGDVLPAIGEYTVPFMDARAAVREYLRGLNLPLTTLFTAPYYYHLAQHVTRGTDGQFTLTLPTGSRAIPAVSCEAVADAVVALLKDDATIGQDVGLASDNVTAANIASAVSRALGGASVAVSSDVGGNASGEAYTEVMTGAHGWTATLAASMSNALRLYAEFGAKLVNKDVRRTKALAPTTATSFAQWMSEEGRLNQFDHLRVVGQDQGEEKKD